VDITANAPLPGERPGHEAPAGRPVPWSLGDVLVGIGWFIGLFFAGQVLVVPVALAYGAKSHELYATALVIGAVVEVAIAVVAFELTARRYGGGIAALGIGPPSWRTLRWALAAFVLAMAVSYAYGILIEVLAAVTVIAFAPVCEELFFRGFLFPGLARGWGVVPAIIISGVLFGAAHLLYKSFIPIAGVGIVFAFAYYRSGNILSTMLAHLAFNSLSIAFIAGGACDTVALPHALTVLR
jgi:membrane protease YdiL (CAAX protease family)